MKSINNKKRFLLGAALIGGVNVLLRSISVSFNAYVSAKAGAEGMGLLSLVMSVFGMSVTLATSGINLAAMRLTAEKLAPLNENGTSKGEYIKCVRSVILKCCIYSLCFGLTTAVGVNYLSEYIGEVLLGDKRTVLSIRIFSYSLPAISLSSALSGYFTGVRKVHKNAVSAIIEQGIKIVLTSTALTLTTVSFTDKIEYACVAVVGGGAIAEGFSLAINLVMYLTDSKRPVGSMCTENKINANMTKLNEVGRVAFPIALGAYARQGLTTAEHLFIPRGMRMSGLGGASSLAAYGVLQGMVFPLILFPSSVLSSAANLLIPELAESMSLDNKERIRRIISSVFKWTIVFSVGCTAVFFAFSDTLGMMIYGNAEASRYLRVCSLLVPIMYFDITVDCMLKGLGEQIHSMKINIFDSALSLLLVVLLVPTFGISGYLLSVYVCEGLNCLLSALKLYKVTKLFPNFKSDLLPSLLCSTFAVVLCSIIPSWIGSERHIYFRIALCSLIYLFTFRFFTSKRKKL